VNTLLAIDPGPTQSAFAGTILLDLYRLLSTLPNENMLEHLRDATDSHLAIEMVDSLYSALTPFAFQHRK